MTAARPSAACAGVASPRRRPAGAARRGSFGPRCLARRYSKSAAKDVMVRLARPWIRPTSWLRRFAGVPSFLPRAFAAARLKHSSAPLRSVSGSRSPIRARLEQPSFIVPRTRTQHAYIDLLQTSPPEQQMGCGRSSGKARVARHKQLLLQVRSGFSSRRIPMKRRRNLSMTSRARSISWSVGCGGFVR